ncbi:17193_t:CDS:2, partial [Rhizophagus irregularis]
TSEIVKALNARQVALAPPFAAATNRILEKMAESPVENQEIIEE